MQKNRNAFGLLEAFLALVIFALIAFYASSLGLESLKRFEEIHKKDRQDTQALSTLAFLARQLQYAYLLPSSTHKDFTFFALAHKGLFIPMRFEQCQDHQILLAQTYQKQHWLGVYGDPKQIFEVLSWKEKQIQVRENLPQECVGLVGLEKNEISLKEGVLRFNGAVLNQGVASFEVKPKDGLYELKLCLMGGRCYVRLEWIERRFYEK